MKLRINFFLAYNEPSSLARIVASLANELAIIGHEVCISFPLFPGAHIQSYKIPYLPYPLVKLLIKIRYFHYFFTDFRKRWLPGDDLNPSKNITLNQFILSPNNSNMPDSDFLILMQSYAIRDLSNLNFKKGSVVDFLVSSHFENDTGFFGQFWASMLTTIYKRYTAPYRVAVSHGVKDYFCSKEIEVDKVLHLGVDRKLFFHSACDKKDSSILMFCDTKPVKGFAFGLSVVEALKHNYPHLKIYAIGRSLTDLDLRIFDGVYENLPDKEYAAAIRRHRYFFYPSFFDGFPAPPLEAMSSGSCCVLSNVPGVNDYAVHNKNCLLYDVGNYGAALHCLMKLIDNEKLQPLLSKGAIEQSDKFSWTASASNLSSFLTGEVTASRTKTNG